MKAARPAVVRLVRQVQKVRDNVKKGLNCYTGIDASELTLYLLEQVCVIVRHVGVRTQAQLCFICSHDEYNDIVYFGLMFG